MNNAIVFLSTNYSTNTTIELTLPLYEGKYVEKDSQIVATLINEETIKFNPIKDDNIYYSSDHNLYFFKDYHVGDLLKFLDTDKDALN